MKLGTWESVRGCISGMRYYLKIVRSANRVIHNMFWAYLRHNSVTDPLCARVFKSGNAVFAEIYGDFMVQ